jgi:NAD+ diphosphatase
MEYVFLFSLNEVPCFMVWDELKVDESQFAYTYISFFRSTTQREIGWVSLVGLHLRNWHLKHGGSPAKTFRIIRSTSALPAK